MTNRRLQELVFFLGALGLTVIFALFGKLAMAAIALIVFWIAVVLMSVCTLILLGLFIKDIDIKECDTWQDAIYKLAAAFGIKAKETKETLADQCPYEVDPAPQEEQENQEVSASEAEQTEESEEAHTPVPYENNP